MSQTQIGALDFVFKMCDCAPLPCVGACGEIWPICLERGVLERLQDLVDDAAPLDQGGQAWLEKTLAAFAAVLDRALGTASILISRLVPE